MNKVEISLKEIIIYVFRRWVPIMAVALVVMMLFSGYGYIKQKAINSNAIPVATSSYVLNLSIDMPTFQGTSSDSYHITLATNDFWVSYKLDT